MTQINYYIRYVDDGVVAGTINFHWKLSRDEHPQHDFDTREAAIDYARRQAKDEWGKGEAPQVHLQDKDGTWRTVWAPRGVQTKYPVDDNGP